MNSRISVSIVTPTFRRPAEVAGLLDNLNRQTVLPAEVILVDGAPPEETATEETIEKMRHDFAFKIRYVRHAGGTAIQRNKGIDLAVGDFVALVDDDVRLEPDFLEQIIRVFAGDDKIGGVVGYRTNRHFSSEQSTRWRWYKRLRLLRNFEPGKYDFDCGYPINNNMQPPFRGTRAVDFMTTACAVWRREVFDSGLRFDEFFRDYGVLEDAHFALRAGRSWKLLQCGDARCEELHSPNGRQHPRKIGYKSVVNYYFVFQDIVRPLSRGQQWRFWRYQMFELLRIASSAVRRRNTIDAIDVIGRMQGFVAVATGSYKKIK